MGLTIGQIGQIAAGGRGANGRGNQGDGGKTGHGTQPYGRGGAKHHSTDIDDNRFGNRDR
jgi:hypothetical protein